MALGFKLLCLSALVATAFQLRVKRQSQDNVLEIYFVVDPKALKVYTDLGMYTSEAKTQALEELDYLITQVNVFYESLKPDVNLQVAIKKVYFHYTDVVKDDKIQQDYYAHAEGGLNDFDEFLSKDYLYDIPDYDLAMLLTGYDLFDKTPDVAGLAHVGTICKDTKASSIVEFDGTYSTAITLAHEVAHNLGSHHDGGDKGYVMSPVSAPNADNRWSFSAESIKNISKTIDALSSNCMLTSQGGSSIPNKDYSELITDPDTICKRDQEHHQSYMCRGRKFYDGAPPSGDSVCKRLYCQVIGSSSCETAISSDGIVCGTGKACREGSCVADSSNPKADDVTDEQCIYGDSPWVDFGFFAGTCTDFFATETQRYCDQAGVSDVCCATCASFKRKRYVDDENDDGKPLMLVTDTQTMTEKSKRLIDTIDFIQGTTQTDTDEIDQLDDIITDPLNTLDEFKDIPDALKQTVQQDPAFGFQLFQDTDETITIDDVQKAVEKTIVIDDTDETME